MNKKLAFLWIDDMPGRRTTSDNLKRNLNVKLEFLNLKNKNIEEELLEIQSRQVPDLIVLDHKLEEIGSGLFKLGSTVATFLREKWPECPMIGITAADIRVDVDFQQREAYEEIYSSSQISRHYRTIHSIAKSFKQLRENRPEDVESMLSLMKAPAEDHVRIKSIIPQELRENIGDKSLIIDISRWLRKIFLDRPGFVYDRIWVATFLGLSARGFEKVEKLFRTAKYNGIFADDSSERWWKSKVLNILSTLVDKQGLPWEKGRFLPDIKKAEYSACYASDEEFPETVAFVDDSPAAVRWPMRLKYTIPHPNYEDLLFFDEIRMMKPA